MFGAIARLTFHYPKYVLAFFAVFVVAAFTIAGGVESKLLPAGFTHEGAEATGAIQGVADELGYDPRPGVVVIATARDGEISAGEARGGVADLANQLREDPAIGFVATPFNVGPDQAGTLVSGDGSSAMILAHFRETDTSLLEDPAVRIQEELETELVDFQIGGYAIGFNDVNEQISEDLIRAELIAFPILTILLLLVFRSAVAASIPLLMGVIAVGGTFFGLFLLAEVTEVSIFALNITTALGLGLAVDYGLLLTSRYREELARHGPGWDAHRAMVGTAGRAVFFSGLTVAAATAAMLVFPQRFLYSMGAGATMVALFASLAALLATPSILALLGERVNALPIRGGRTSETGSGRWYRLSHWVMRRPIGVATGVLLLLVLMAAPLTGATLTQPGNDAVPRDKESRMVSERLGEEFTPNIDTPIGVTVEGAAAAEVARQAATLDGVLAQAPPQPLPSGDVYLQLIPENESLTPATQDLAKELRAISVAETGESRVSGVTADFIDFKDNLIEMAPLALALVTVTTLFLLFMLTGSVVLPLKTLIINFFAIFAALGITVLVFQENWGGSLLGYDGPPALETALIVVVGATTFGLATDYAVLVLSRIKEFHDAGNTTEEAIALGIDRTGRVVTAAAMLLAVVFLAFITNEVFFMKEVGLSQAVAVAIDATIIRALLVPSLMKMFGEWNWWAPAPLRRFHDRFGLDEGPPPGSEPSPGPGDLGKREVTAAPASEG